MGFSSFYSPSNQILNVQASPIPEGFHPSAQSEMMKVIVLATIHYIFTLHLAIY